MKHMKNLLVLLLILLIPACAMADTSTFYVEELGLYIDLPSDWYTNTVNDLPQDGTLAESMKADGIYLMSMSIPSFDYYMWVRASDASSLQDLAQASEEDYAAILTILDKLGNTTPDATVGEYQNDPYRFLKFLVPEEDSFRLSYATIANAHWVYFDFYFDDPVTDEQESVCKGILDSVRFE